MPDALLHSVLKREKGEESFKVKRRDGHDDSCAEWRLSMCDKDHKLAYYTLSYLSH
jgi:hypothetical protein